MSESGYPTDVRWPIGLLFAVAGAALDAYGAAVPARGNVVVLPLNLDLWWGGAVLLFGGAMLWGAWRAGRRRA